MAQASPPTISRSVVVAMSMWFKSRTHRLMSCEKGPLARWLVRGRART